jgi:hypothetical protein
MMPGLNYNDWLAQEYGGAITSQGAVAPPPAPAMPVAPADPYMPPQMAGLGMEEPLLPPGPAMPLPEAAPVEAAPAAPQGMQPSMGAGGAPYTPPEWMGRQPGVFDQFVESRNAGQQMFAPPMQQPMGPGPEQLTPIQRRGLEAGLGAQQREKTFGRLFPTTLDTLRRMGGQTGRPGSSRSY